MVLSNRKGDFLLPRPAPTAVKKGLAKKKNATKKRAPFLPRPIPSAYQFMQGVPDVRRSTPTATTQTIQLSTTGATKAQVIPSSKPGMSKQKKGAIIGGTIGGAFAAAWGAGSIMNYMEKQAFNKANTDYAKKSEDGFEMVRDMGFPKTNVNRFLKENFSAKPEERFMEDVKDVGFGEATKNALHDVAHPAPASEADEWFDAVEDIAHIAE